MSGIATILQFQRPGRAMAARGRYQRTIAGGGGDARSAPLEGRQPDASGTPRAPICQGQCTVGTSATPIWRIIFELPERPLSAEHRSTSCVDVSPYALAYREDCTVSDPYITTQLISAEVRFTLAAGGHIVGVINAASRNKRSFWVEGQLGKPDGLLDRTLGARERTSGRIGARGSEPTPERRLPHLPLPGMRNFLKLKQLRAAMSRRGGVESSPGGLDLCALFHSARGGLKL